MKYLEPSKAVLISNSSRADIEKLLVFPQLALGGIDGPYSVEKPYITKHSKERRHTHVGCCACGAMGKTLYKVGENRYCAQCKSNLRSDVE